MSNRIYILIAVAILIVSPIIVNALSTALPPPSTSNATENVAAPEAIEETAEQGEPEAESPPPAEIEPGSTEPVFDVQPSMDAAGIAPAPIADESGSDSVPPPAPARQPAPSAQPVQEAAPPPPPRPEIPASMNR